LLFDFKSALDFQARDRVVRVMTTYPTTRIANGFIFPLSHNGLDIDLLIVLFRSFYYLILALVIITGAHSEMVDFGSGQGRSDFETDSVAVIVSTGVARVTSRISKKREHRHGSQDAIYRWILTGFQGFNIQKEVE